MTNDMEDLVQIDDDGNVVPFLRKQGGSRADALPQPAVDVENLAEQIAKELMDTGWLGGNISRAEVITEDIAEWIRAHLAQPQAPGVVEALAELLEVAELRGDDQLPHPADDSLMWTARMQTAWHEAQNALHRVRRAQEQDAKRPA